MRTSLMIILALTLIAVFAGSEARYYKKINNDYVAYVDWARGKRQSHPDQTVARLPQIPFGDAVANEALPSGAGQIDENVPAPAEYLTPPAPDTPIPQAAPPQLKPQQPPPQQPPLQQPPIQPPPSFSDNWNLGFDASDVLVPPVTGDQASQYDTLKLFTLLPTSSEPQGELLDSFGPEEQELAADSRTPFIDSYRPEFQSLRLEDASRPHRDSPVYTFVKTDPHGHFKWGVHIGH